MGPGFGETVQRYLQRAEERRQAALETCTVTRPLTPADLEEPEVIKPEPEPIIERREEEYTYFTGPVKTLDDELREAHRPRMRDTGEHRRPKAKKKRWPKWKKRIERLLEIVGLAYDD